MTITHSIPTTTRKPGQFHEFDLTSSAAGLVPLSTSVLGFGVQLAGATATVDQVNEIFDEAQSDLLFVKGSEAALMARKALEVGKLLGFQPTIFIAGLTDPGGTAATFTFTVVGTADGGGDVVFRIAGRTLRAGVSDGDTETVVAVAMKAVIDEAQEAGILPVSAAAVAGVVTCTALYTGVNGNDIEVSVEDIGLTGLTSVTAADAVPGVGTVDPTTALANSLATFYEMKALANHTATDVTDGIAHLASAWAPAAKRWTFLFLGETGTLGVANTLSSAANSERFAIVSYEGSPSLPGEIAMATATAIAARSLPNYNWDGEELPLFQPIDSLVYTDTEIESALAAGSTPLAPNDNRSQTTIVRMITTKTLEGGSPFERAKDLATIRGLVFVTRQLDVVAVQKFGKGVNKSARVIKRIRSEFYLTLKTLEAIGVVQNVDALFPQLIVENDAVVATRAVASIPESIIPNLHQLIMKHVLFVE